MNKRILLCVALTAAFNVNAMTMPLGRQNTGYDRIRAADGTECQVNTATRTTLTIGAFGEQANNDDSRYDYQAYHSNGGRDEAGVYAGIVIALPDGNPVNRIDCTSLYEREMERKDLELSRLRAEVEMLKQGVHQFEG